MASIMELFNVRMGDYLVIAKWEGFTARFEGKRYPPKIVLEQDVEPMYVMAADGTTRVEHHPQITIVGSVDGEIAVEGDCNLTKKTLNNLVNKGLAIMELYLHGFMQEAKGLERLTEEE